MKRVSCAAPEGAAGLYAVNLGQRQRFSNWRESRQTIQFSAEPLHLRPMKIQPSLIRGATTRTILALVIAALGVGVLGLWLFVHDRPELELEPRLRAERATLDQKLAAVQQRSDTIAAQIPAEQDRVTKSEKVIRQLEELQSTWDMLVGNRAQQRANAERLEHIRKLRAAAVARVAEFQQEVTRTKWERDGYEIERSRVDGQLRIVEAKKAGISYYFRRAWLRLRAWTCIGVAIYLLGPILWRLAIARGWRSAA